MILNFSNLHPDLEGHLLRINLDNLNRASKEMYLWLIQHNLVTLEKDTDQKVYSLDESNCFQETVEEMTNDRRPDQRHN